MFDCEVINQGLRGLEVRIDDFELITNTARAIQANAKDIEDELDEMERAIMRRLYHTKGESVSKSS